MLRQLISADWDVSPKVVAFSTTRQGGVSSAPFNSLNIANHVSDDPSLVTANRELLSQSLPEQLSWQWLEQVHGTEAVIVDEAGPETTADAVVTSRPNLVCCIQTADCLPLFVAAVDGSEVAAIHAGWKGLASGVIENTIARMHTPSKDVAVWLGPAIGPCHYEVGVDVRDYFLTATNVSSQGSATEECFTPSSASGKYMADLYALARLRLSILGIERVSGGDCCTFCDTEKFYSYRRDGITGRMLNAIYIEA